MSFLERLWGRGSQAVYQRGMHAFNAGRLEEALVSFALVLDTSAPSDPLHSLSCFYSSEAAHALGVRHLLAGDAGAACEEFTRALAWNNRFPELQYHAAVAWVLQGNRAPARQALEAALAQNPDHFEARVLLAELAFRDGNTTEGEHHVQQAQERGRVRDVDAALLLLADAGMHEAVAACLQQPTPRSVPYS